MKRLEQVRVLMYSHDTFGLGHLRRCRAIAHALVERFKGVQVLIVSGSPIAGAFDFRARVDFVKIPSVIKLHNGEYTAMEEHIDIQQTLEMRMSMIRDAARSFQPDLFIVDKEPLGLRGELEDTLHELQARGCTLVLGLREVMDSPELLAMEWSRKNMLPRIDELYDEIWIYGPQSFWNPFVGLDVSARIAARSVFTGFIDRQVPCPADSNPFEPGSYLLATTGGGGDGSSLVHQLLDAYEHDPHLPHQMVIVLGPFMPTSERERILRRTSGNARLHVVEFHSKIEGMIRDCAALIGMCGYNTFCEVLSFDKRALMVPRLEPREEQFVRAKRAADLGLVDMLHPDEAAEPSRMAAALRRVVERAKPFEAGGERMLNGLDTVADRTEHLIAARLHPRLSLVRGAG